VLEGAVRISGKAHIFRGDEVVTGAVGIREKTLPQRPRRSEDIIRYCARRRGCLRSDDSSIRFRRTGLSTGCEIPGRSAGR